MNNHLDFVFVACYVVDLISFSLCGSLSFYSLQIRARAILFERTVHICKKRCSLVYRMAIHEGKYRINWFSSVLIRSSAVLSNVVTRLGDATNGTALGTYFERLCTCMHY